MSEQNNTQVNEQTPVAAPTISEEALYARLPEEAKELEQLRTRRLEAERAANDSRVRALELEQENAALHQKAAISQSFREAGIRFHPSQADVVKLLTAQGGQIEVIDGKAVIDGVDLAGRLTEYALANPTLADGRSLRALREREEASKPKLPASKADLASVADKVKFIEEHGSRAYEMLPQRSPLDLKGKLPNSWNEYMQLSTSERAKVAAKAGPGFIAELHRRRAVA
jgi:hypothetical protein